MPDDVKFSMAYKNLYGDKSVEEISMSDIEESYNYIFGDKKHSLPSKPFVLYRLAQYEINGGVYELQPVYSGCENWERFYAVNCNYIDSDECGVYVTGNSIAFDVTIGYSGEETIIDGPSYRFTFVKQSDHYIFDSVKRIK